MSSNFDTYSGFRSTVYSWADCGTGDISASLMDDMARIAQRRIQNGGTILLGERSVYVPRVKCRQNEKALSIAIAAGVSAVPSDYLELKQAYVTIGGVKMKLDRTETDMLYRKYPVSSTTGDPVLIARDGSNFVFGPVPADGTLTGTYYRTFPDYAGTTLSLTDSLSADYNSLYAFSPEMYLYATLMEVEPILMREARAQMWAQKYISIVDSLNTADQAERFSGSPLSIRIQ